MNIASLESDAYIYNLFL
uniref:Uncharacterized protein n=1 Tax=Arundo donax TaxID=35708 RepID=A0A0A9AT35_ARUDO